MSLLESLLSCLCGLLQEKEQNVPMQETARPTYTQPQATYIQPQEGFVQPPTISHGYHQSDINIDNDAQQLRNKAGELSQQRHDLSAKSQEAFRSGAKQDAKMFSDQAKALMSQADNINHQASMLIYQSKNKGRGIAEIDLHGQFVREALALADNRIEECKLARVDKLVIIVGKGLHSIDGKAKIKPAIQDLLQKHHLSAHPGPNEGCFTVLLAPNQQIQHGMPTDHREVVNSCPIQ